ncbi:MAG: flagellar motor switch protein FliN [Planctomycetota bacterium]
MNEEETKPEAEDQAESEPQAQEPTAEASGDDAAPEGDAAEATASSDDGSGGGEEPNELLAAAAAAIADLNSDVSGAAEPASDATSAVEMPSFEGGGELTDTSDIDLLSDVKLDVEIELGRTRMLVEDVIRLGEGCVIELDKLAGDPVDVYVNGRHIARGEVLVLNDSFCVRISEVLTTPQSKSA